MEIHQHSTEWFCFSGKDLRTGTKVPPPPPPSQSPPHKLDLKGTHTSERKKKKKSNRQNT